ncbi:tetratricopeptide repeat protein [Asticcacaulis sp. BYS171W]|uniref:Tetratricopeptide repeat protein n=1 Tax=Asticcacaulis aquaticus TaxID=2984212 RepID=A0ABT5HWL2_9CAUL|nr:tetratricopeptide repeat protein [Asticcacaulis aquaticus]MDC7684323.1 tetratricopeptide repeat protein [Asticcacaulis aquaticus]
MKSILKSAVAVAALLCLAAPAMARDARFTDNPYGDYLVGKLAASQGDTETAARALMAAADADPANNALRERAFLAAVLGGDMDFAAKHLPESGSRFSRNLGTQVRALDAVRSGNGKAAVTAIEASVALDANDRTTLLLKPLIYAEAKQWDKAIDNGLIAELSPESASKRDRLVVFLQAANQARLLELKGRNADAESVYKLICQPGPANVLFGPYYASFLERRGRKDEARKIYTDILSVSEDRLVRHQLETLDAKGYRKPKKPTVRLIMADSLFLSATLYASEQQPEMALATVRLSQFSSPDTPDAARTQDRSRLLAGQVLVRMRDTQAAQEEWASIEPDSPFYQEAQLRAAWGLKEADDLDGAFEIFTRLNAANPKDADIAVERARILWEKDDTAGAIKLMDDYVAQYGDGAFTWQSWFTLAVLHQASGDWEKTKVAARKGLAFQPDSPELLNLLGYGMIDRNENLPEGVAMVRKALDKSPRSGAIMDSLGWGYFKQGDNDQALLWIERAIALQPADPEINEHLGDVYNAMGRDIEAKFQWSRVLTLEADDAQKASVTAKIEAADKLAAQKLAEADAVKPAPKPVTKPVIKTK